MSQKVLTIKKKIFVNETFLQGHWQAGLGLSLVLYGQLYVLCDFGNIIDAAVIYLISQIDRSKSLIFFKCFLIEHNDKMQ